MKSGENFVSYADALRSLHDDARALARRAPEGFAALHMAVRPQPPIWLNEQIIAQLRNFLTGLQTEIIGKLTIDPPMMAAHAYPPALVHFLYARVIEGQLAMQPGQSPAELPPGVQKLISGDDARLADLGMGYLVAQNRFLRGCDAHRFAADELSAELFHAMVHDAGPAGGSATAMLLDHDEARIRTNILGRVASLLTVNAQWQAVSRPVAYWGSSLFLALLAEHHDFGLDRIVWLAAEPGQLRLALVLRASGLEPEAAMQSLVDLHHAAMPERDARLTVPMLDNISPAEAQATVAAWSTGGN